MAERLTPYLLRRVLDLPLADKAALMAHLKTSMNIGQESPSERLGFLAQRMEEVSGVDVKEGSRRREVVTARFIFIFVARREGFTQEFVGSFLGRNHATVCQAEKKMRDAFTLPAIFQDEITLYNKFVEAL